MCIYLYIHRHKKIWCMILLWCVLLYTLHSMPGQRHAANVRACEDLRGKASPYRARDCYSKGSLVGPMQRACRGLNILPLPKSCRSLRLRASVQFSRNLFHAGKMFDAWAGLQLLSNLPGFAISMALQGQTFREASQ